jgi:phosphoinositide-3-kinase regulatory subunit 4
VRRLERDVSFASRLTYAGQSGRITGLCPVLDGSSVASGSASGSLHVWRVEYTSKPGGWAPDKYRGARQTLRSHRFLLILPLS